MSLVNDMLRDLEARSERRAQAAHATSNSDRQPEPAVRMRLLPALVVAAATVAVMVTVQKFFLPAAATSQTVTSESVAGQSIADGGSMAPQAPVSPSLATTEPVPETPANATLPVATGDIARPVLEPDDNGNFIVATKAVHDDERNTLTAHERTTSRAADGAEDSITRQLILAEQCLVADRLTTPAGDNALAYYQAVLAAVPDHARALAGIEAIINRYSELAEIARKKNEVGRVERYRQRARDLAEQYAVADIWATRFQSQEPSPSQEKSQPQQQPGMARTPSSQYRDQQLLREARQWADAGDIATAISHLEQFVDGTQDFPASRQLLVDLYVGSGRYRDALAQWDGDTSLSDDERRLRRSRVFIAEQAFQSALEELAGAEPAMQTHQDYYALQAALLHRLGRYQDAAALYQRLVAVERNRFTYWLGLAVSLDSMHDAAALQAFRRAKQLGGADGDSLRYVDQRIASLSEPG